MNGLSEGMRNQPDTSSKQWISMAMSPHPSGFAPLVFAGRLAEGIERLAKAGFNGVEISIRHASDLDTNWLSSILGETGLAVSAFASGRMYLEESLCLSDPDPSVRKKIYEDISEILSLAAQFQAPLVIGGVRGKLSGNQVQMAEQRACAIETLARCAQVAENLGTYILLEPINRYETNFINSAQDGLDMIEEIGHPAVRMLLDTFHMNIEEVDMCATIREVGDHLGYMHIADSNRLAPGQGHIDFAALLRTLGEIHYHGYISAEILPLPDDAAALTNTGYYLHTLLDKFNVI